MQEPENRSYRDDARPSSRAQEAETAGNNNALGVARPRPGPLMRLTGAISPAANIAAMGLLFCIMLLVTMDVALRTFVNVSIPGASEIAGLLQVLMVFLGIGYTLRMGQHIKVDMLMEHMPARFQRVTDVSTSLLAFVVFCFVTYALFHVGSGPRAARESSDLLAIKLQPFKYAAALGTGLMCLEMLRQLRNLLRGRNAQEGRS